MPRLKITISCAGDGFDYQPDQVVDVDDDLALDLLNAGYAEAVVEKPAEKKSTRTVKARETR